MALLQRGELWVRRSYGLVKGVHTHRFGGSGANSEGLGMSPQRPYTRLLFRRVVVQVLAEPSLDFCHAHPLAFAIVGDLIAIDLSETKIS